MRGRSCLVVGLLALGGVVAGGGCARGPRLGAVTPAEIPALVARAQQEPRNPDVMFRLAAALLAAGRCDTAVAVARAGVSLEPRSVLAPMVIGGCHELDGRYDLAVGTYNDFAARYPQARGVAALRGKAQLALRAGAEQTARAALAREAELTALAPEPRTLAVLPVTVAGDTTYSALSRGLAELLTSDLALLRSIRLLERLQIGAVLDELKLGATERADPATAARMGRILRAERMVQGVASIPPRGWVRLQASVVTPDGGVHAGPEVTGPFRKLLDLEKQLVIGLGAELGLQLTDAERQRILRQGTRSLTAFLAYSEGLAAMDRGDYRAAAERFSAALRADPSFRAADQQRQAAEAAPVIQQAGVAEVVSIVEAVSDVVVVREPVATGALSSATSDVAPAQSDALARQAAGVTTGTETTTRQTTPEARGITNVHGAHAIIRIIFRRP